MTALVFDVPLPPRALSSNGAHGHWASKARAKAEYRETVSWLAKAAMLQTNWPVAVAWPRQVDLLFGIKGARKEGRYQPRDESNALSAFKAGFDGMVDAGVVRDDSRRWMHLGETRITAEDGPWVRITVTVAEADLYNADPADREWHLSPLPLKGSAHVAGTKPKAWSKR